MTPLGRLRRRLLGISPAQVRFDRLGFPAVAPERRGTVRRLEAVMLAFAEGFGIALEAPDAASAAGVLRRRFDAHLLGFAFEGAGMCWALYDLLLPWGGGRLRRAIEGECAGHDYIMTVGAGFALARLPWGEGALERFVGGLDPMIGWCVPDGYGFHQALFDRPEYVETRRAAPASWPAYARRLFDSGVGRSLWWSESARPARIAAVIDRFAPARRAEMYCGLGVACAYAGGGDADAPHELLRLAGPLAADVASGAFFAARMRQRGGNPSAVTESVCRLWLGLSAEEAGTRAFAARRRIERELPAGCLREECYAVLREHLLDDARRALASLPVVSDPSVSPSHDPAPRSAPCSA